MTYFGSIFLCLHNIFIIYKGFTDIFNKYYLKIRFTYYEKKLVAGEHEKQKKYTS